MIDPEIPEFDALDPDGNASNRLGFELPDEPAAGEMPENADEPAAVVAEPAAPVGAGRRDRTRTVDFGPAGNGRNGHARLGKTVRAPARSDRPASRRPTGTARPPGSDARDADTASPAGDSLLAALATSAAAAADNEETALLAAAMVPLALSVAEPRARALRPSVPALVKGIAGLAVWLVEEDAWSLIPLLPLILEETIRALDRAATEGRSITCELAGDLLARQTEKIINRHADPRAKRRDIPPRPRKPRPGKPWQQNEWNGLDDDDHC